MAFKDGKGKEKFTDLTNRFEVGKNELPGFSSIDTLKRYAGLSNTDIGNYVDALQAQVRANGAASISGNLFASNGRKTEFSDNIETEFIENTAEVYTEEGYNIQTDILEEREMTAEFLGEPGKKVFFSDGTKKSVEVAARPTINTSKEDAVDRETTFAEQDDTPFTDRKETFQADKKSLFKSNDNNIQFEYGKNGGNFVSNVSANVYNELANQSTPMFVAGADGTENYWGRNEGLQEKTITSKWKIAAYEEKAVIFGDKAEKLFEGILTEGDGFAEPNLDNKMITAVSHSVGKRGKVDPEYRQIQKEAKNETKGIKEEANSNKKAFKESVVSFSAGEDKFTDKYADSFTDKFTDAYGNSIFEPPKKQKAGRPVTIIQKETANELEKESGVNHAGEVPKKQAEAGSRLEIPETSEEKQSSVGKETEPYFGEEKESFDSENKAAERFVSINEKFDQIKPREKTAKEEREKKLKKAAALTALSNVLRTKNNVQNEFGDMSAESSGDLIKEGKRGLLKTVTDEMKGIVGQMVSTGAKKIISMAAGACAAVFIPIVIIMVCFLLMSGTTGALAGMDSDSGEEYDVDLPGGDGATFTSLSASEIDQIIEGLWGTYPGDMTYTIEDVLRYALSKVGCAYDQNYHGSLSVDIFDCSSLAYRSYREVGIDIKNGDSYTAAEECRAMENQNKVVGSHLVPGDLIFYGGANNGRYKGVYHVAIYVGNGKMVEAKGKSYGVVYGDVRSNNIVACARPTL